MRADDWKKERVQRRLDEMEAGRKAVMLYEKLAKVEAATGKLREAFPRLNVSSVLNAPYTHVTIRARPQFLAPISSMAVLSSDNYSTTTEAHFEDPIEEYPTEHLIAQLALLS